MSGARRCCCTTDEPPISPCGCDGPIKIGMTGGNAQYVHHFCATNNCADWTGNQIVRNWESSIADILFECVVTDEGTGDHEWQLVPAEDNTGIIRITYGVASDSFALELTGPIDMGDCAEEFDQTASADIEFPLDDITDGVTFQEYSGSIRNENVQGIVGSRAVLRLKIRLKASDLFEDYQVVQPDGGSNYVIYSPNAPIAWAISVLLVGDRALDEETCPTDVDWSYELITNGRGHVFVEAGLYSTDLIAAAPEPAWPEDPNESCEEAEASVSTDFFNDVTQSLYSVGSYGWTSQSHDSPFVSVTL